VTPCLKFNSENIHEKERMYQMDITLIIKNTIRMVIRIYSATAQTIVRVSDVINFYFETSTLFFMVLSTSVVLNSESPVSIA
jgi:hypothetical protein